MIFKYNVKIDVDSVVMLKPQEVLEFKELTDDQITQGMINGIKTVLEESLDGKTTFNDVSITYTTKEV